MILLNGISIFQGLSARWCSLISSGNWRPAIYIKWH